MLAVNEPRLYHAIFMSRKDAAREFRRWVTGEVLPAIRRTGAYGATLDAELEQERKRLEVSRLRANRYILEHLEELGERRLLSRAAIQGIVGNAAGDNSACAFSDEDGRVKNFIFEACRIVETGFVPAAELYSRYPSLCQAAVDCEFSYCQFYTKVMKSGGPVKYSGRTAVLKSWLLEHPEYGLPEAAEGERKI